jgi:hypothetical protein
MSAEKTAENKPSIEIIFSAICELCAEGRPATREEIRDLTVLPMSVVSDALSRLRDAGKIIAVTRGIYAPSERFAPARPVSCTILSSGEIKVEVGDDVLTLTPREAKMLGALMCGQVIKITNQ